MVGIVGMVLYAAVGFLYVSSGLVVPYPWLFLVWGVWVAGLFVLAKVFRRAPAWTPAVAVGAVLLWGVILSLGDWLLGWTA